MLSVQGLDEWAISIASAGFLIDVVILFYQTFVLSPNAFVFIQDLPMVKALQFDNDGFLMFSSLHLPINFAVILYGIFLVPEPRTNDQLI